MHEALRDVPNRILEVATAALAQANTHAVFSDPGKEHWEIMCVLNAAQAGELFLKAIIAKENPLLIFKDLFHLDDGTSEVMDIKKIIEKGRTYNFDQLPKLLWVATGCRLPDPENFERLRRIRNSLQHFCAPPGEDFRHLSLEFIYRNLDPLMRDHFDLFAIEYHEDISVSYDYVVQCLVAHELPFSVPRDFEVTEIDLKEELAKASMDYRKMMASRFSASGYAINLPGGE